MRNIADVIKQIEAVLPAGDPLLDDLRRLYVDCTFTAPETMILRWRQFQSYLIDRFKEELGSDLAIKVRDIFADKHNGS
jgi:hypothetical protein